MPAGYGYADIVFLPLPRRDKPAIVVELKYNKAAQTAIQQIRDKNYVDALKDYKGDVILVGINYSKDRKEEGHSCKIERVKYSENNKWMEINKPVVLSLKQPYKK